MDLIEAIKSRHSVRSFTDKRIEEETEIALHQAIHDCNKKSGLHIRLCLNEENAFSGRLAHYGKFENCKNYIVLAGKDGTDEQYGYYGEQIVLLAQTLGLNTCWVAMTYSKSKIPCVLEEREKIRLVIALGYGKTQGVQHKSKDMAQLCKVEGVMPEWFKAGMELAMLAPTAVNQQKFLIALDGNTVTAKTLPSIIGNTKIDLGIVKCHFEIGAGVDNFKWAK